MNTNALATAVAAKGVAIAGMRGTSATTPDTIPASPWLIVGAHYDSTGDAGRGTNGMGWKQEISGSR